MSGKSNKVNKQLEDQQAVQMKRQNDLFEKSMQDTPELIKWRKDSSEWDSFLSGKDYSKPPASSILNFDLFNPAQIQKQSAKMADLEGVGAAGLGGDNSIALQMARERNANEAGQMAGASYEDAIKGQDAYFKGASPQYMQSENARWGNLFGQQSANASNAQNAWLQYKMKPSPWAQALGAAIQTGGQLASSFMGGGGGG